MPQIAERAIAESHETDDGSDRLEHGVYRVLFDRIKSARYAAGEKLPSEMELSLEFDVSRPVVRAALSRLRDEGLIISKRGSGSYVDHARPDEARGFTPLRSIADFAAYWDFRKLVESEAAAQAAIRRDPELLKRLVSLQARLGDAVRYGQPTVDLNMQLHTTIAEMSGNHFFGDTLRLLVPQMDFVGKFLRSLGAETYRSGKFVMQDEHQAIVDAIIAGKPEDARKAMIAHIESSERRVLKGE